MLTLVQCPPLFKGEGPFHDMPAHRKSIKQVLFPYLLIAPTFLLVAMFTLLPTVNTFISSLYRPPLTVRQTEQFVGLQNYIDLIDPANSIRPDMGAVFGRILFNTLAFTGATVIVSVPLAFLIALLLNRKLRFRPLWRFSLFYPVLLPLIGAASIWSFIYADNIGLANTVLRSIGLEGVKWIGSAELTLISIITVSIWKQTGYFMIFYLAGMQGIPRDIYEAAEMEGASGLQVIRFITIPLLRRTTLFILVIASTMGFQMVEQLQALGQGGPAEASNLLLYYIFQRFSDTRNWGYVNAMSVILLLILMVFTVTNFYFFEWRQLRRDEQEQH